MKHMGRSVTRIDDKTDHGGTVAAASSSTLVLGRAAALEGDATECPRCKGAFAMRPTGDGSRHQGQQYAFEGDVTECGARQLASF
jgi:uncharacterized Zn-binding protein involved in type VI secretion